LTLAALAAAAGLAISAYLTLTHYQAVPLACPTGGLVDCALVTQSRYGLIPGTRLPIGFAGLAWFAVSLGLALAALRARVRPLLLAGALVGWGLAGLAAALYLVYVELALLRHLCEWCTATHVLVLAILLLAVGRLQKVAQEGA
jgi:uncharacterized membrane protein